MWHYFSWILFRPKRLFSKRTKEKLINVSWRMPLFILTGRKLVRINVRGRGEFFIHTDVIRVWRYSCVSCKRRARRTRTEGVLGKVAEKDKGTLNVGSGGHRFYRRRGIRIECRGGEPTLCWGVLRMIAFVDVSEWKSKKTVKELNYLDNSHHHNKKSPLVRLKTVTQKILLSA